jgi:hypothetical protein
MGILIKSGVHHQKKGLTPAIQSDTRNHQVGSPDISAAWFLSTFHACKITPEESLQLHPGHSNLMVIKGAHKNDLDSHDMDVRKLNPHSFVFYKAMN